MARCALGPKKLRKIETLTGFTPRKALVRGGYEHYWAMVFFDDSSSDHMWVNYKTGEVAWDTHTLNMYPELGGSIRDE